MHSALRTLLTSLAILLLHNSIAQPIIERNNTQSWYGRVNGWHTSRSLLKQELDLMQECGVSGYMIELAGWGHDVGEAWNEEWINTIKKGVSPHIKAVPQARFMALCLNHKRQYGARQVWRQRSIA